MPGKRTPNFAPVKVWRGWAIADAKRRMVRDKRFGEPFIYTDKRDALADAEEGQIAVRVIVTVAGEGR